MFHSMRIMALISDLSLGIASAHARDVNISVGEQPAIILCIIYHKFDDTFGIYIYIVKCVNIVTNFHDVILCVIYISQNKVVFKHLTTCRSFISTSIYIS